jgi:hypothetical protein
VRTLGYAIDHPLDASVWLEEVLPRL